MSVMAWISDSTAGRKVYGMTPDSSRQREPPCFGELLVELYGLVEGFFELLLGLAVGGPIAVLHGGLAVFHGLGGIVQCLLEFGTASGVGLPG